jgi:hypothetical protein
MVTKKTPGEFRTGVTGNSISMKDEDAGPKARNANG